jgi:SAM-dependent MidA family methyltransferase
VRVSATHVILERIRARGPMTVAEFMDAALYDPASGYYASAPQRSGRSGDFYTSVDVGPLFGEMIAAQLDEMWRALRVSSDPLCDLVEAGAGNGRLARDVLDAAEARFPDFYSALRLTLVERSARARACHAATLGPHAARLRGSQADLPPRIHGVIVANELLDALPVHVVVSRSEGLREIYVDERAGSLVEVEGELSDDRIESHLARAPFRLEPGARCEIGLAACDWIRHAADRLERGFILLFDYGQGRTGVDSAPRILQTLTSYRRHVADDRWLDEPGERDLTAHVDFPSVAMAAQAAGLDVLGQVDQTYFLMGLGLADRIDGDPAPRSRARRLAAKTLMLPGGRGSTIKVLILGRGVGRPALAALSGGRVT